MAITSRIQDAILSLDGPEVLQLRTSKEGQIRLYQLAAMVEDECRKVYELVGKPDDELMQHRFRDRVYTRVADRWAEQHLLGLGPIMVIVLGNLIWWFIKNVILE